MGARAPDDPARASFAAARGVRCAHGALSSVCPALGIPPVLWKYINEAPVLVFLAPSTSPTSVCVCDL